MIKFIAVQSAFTPVKITAAVIMSAAAFSFIHLKNLIFALILLTSHMKNKFSTLIPHNGC